MRAFLCRFIYFIVNLKDLEVLCKAFDIVNNGDVFWRRVQNLRRCAFAKRCFALLSLKYCEVKNPCKQIFNFFDYKKTALFRREFQIAYSVVSVKKMLFAITLCRNCYCETKKAFLHLLETHIVFIGGYLLG